MELDGMDGRDKGKGRAGWEGVVGRVSSSQEKGEG